MTARGNRLLPPNTIGAKLNDSDFNMVERQLGLKLPAGYRSLALDPPFSVPEHDWMYWFYVDPAHVIHGTLNPLDGNCPPDAIPSSYFAFGETAFGDIYVLDSQRDDSPVYCLSHETHLLDVEYATLDAYTEEWLGLRATALPINKETSVQRILNWIQKRIRT